MRKSFVFYLSWKNQVDTLNDKELRRFINNLIAWHQDGVIDLKTKSDKVLWNSVIIPLEVNDEKWKAQANNSRENGKKGGRPKKTHQDIQKPVNSKEVNGKEVNSKEVNSKEVNSKDVESNKEEIKSEIEKIILNKSIESSTITTVQPENYINRINDLAERLEKDFPQYDNLVAFSNPDGVKNLKNQIKNKIDLEKISKILIELSELKKYESGNY